MHRSRLAGFIIDCENGDLEAAAEFWSRALGCAIAELSVGCIWIYVRILSVILSPMRIIYHLLTIPLPR